MNSEQIDLDLIMNQHLIFSRENIRNFKFRNHEIKITDSSSQINLIKINKNQRVIAYFLEIKNDEIAYYFLLNIKSILTNIYKKNALSFFSIPFNQLHKNNMKSISNNKNRFSILPGIESESCVILLIDLQKNEAHILFIKKNDDCNLIFLNSRGALLNLIYISLKLFETVNYNGFVYLEDNAQIPIRHSMRSISLLQICNKIIKNSRLFQYSKYNEYDFYLIDQNKLKDLQEFISSLNKNKCEKNNTLNSKLYKFLIDLVNIDYRSTIQKLES